MRHGYFKLIKESEEQTDESLIYEDSVYRLFCINNVKDLKEKLTVQLKGYAEPVLYFEHTCKSLENQLDAHNTSYSFGKHSFVTPIYVVHELDRKGGIVAVTMLQLSSIRHKISANRADRSSSSYRPTFTVFRKMPKELLEKITVDEALSRQYGLSLYSIIQWAGEGKRDLVIPSETHTNIQEMLDSGMYKDMDGFIVNRANVLVSISDELAASDATTLTLPEGIVAATANENKLPATLRKLVLPSTLRLLGDSFCSNVSSLEEVVFSENLEFVGSKCFKHCENLKDLSLPASVKTLGNDAFFCCDNLKVVDLSKTQIECIEGYTFSYCHNLETVLLPESLHSIQISAFYDCKNLGDIELPPNLHTIGHSAFEKSGLFALDIPDSVKQIARQAFSNCSNLSYVKLPALEALPTSSVGEGIFQDCPRLKTVKNPEFLEKATGAFSGCNKFATAAASLLANKKVLDKLDFKNFADEELVLTDKTRAVGYECFKHNEHIRVFKGTASLELIDDAAFYSCENLEVVDLTECTRLKLGARAFSNCRNLHTVKLPKTLKIIPRCCFSECCNLKSIELPASLRKIGSEAFINANLEEGLVLPDRLVAINEGAFQGTRLKSIHLPKGIVAVKRNTFLSCKQLESVIMSDQVVEIEQYAFNSCEKLTDVTVESSDPDFDQYEDIAYETHSFEKCPYKEVLEAAGVHFGLVASRYSESRKLNIRRNRSILQNENTSSGRTYNRFWR